MYQKILAELAKKFPGLPKAFLGLIAKQLEAKVTEDSGIETAITELDNAISIQTLGQSYQSEGDRRVTEARRQWDESNPKPPAPGPKDPPPGPDPKDEPPAWAKGLILTVENLVKEKTTGTIREQAAAKLKDIPAIFWSKRQLPEKPEDLDAFITEVTTDYSEYRQQLINDGLLNETPPKSGEGVLAGKGKEKEVEADITSWANSNKKPGDK